MSVYQPAGRLDSGSRPATRRGSAAGDRDAGYSRLRVLWLLAVAGGLALLIWGRLFYWQVQQHHLLAAEAVSQYTETISLPATRGQVFDSSMLPMAVNVTVYSVFVSPDQVPSSQREHVALQLSTVLGKPEPEVLAILQSKHKFAYIARRQSKEIADRLKTLRLPGVGMLAEEQRSYLPGGTEASSLGSNLLGFVNDDGQGQYGVEAFYNSQLAGKAGSSSTYRDLLGREIVVGKSSQTDPVNGADIVLTIDSSVQHAAEQAIAEGVIQNHAVSGSVLVMDPHTGAIVAWADYPTFNGNSFAGTPVENFIDPAVSHLYEPGSTMKVVTLAGAINNHAITPQTTINDPGYIRIGGFTLGDWDRQNRGVVTFTKVLESSLNVGAIKAMQAEGAEAFYRNLVAFGLGRASGVDVAAESTTPLKAFSDYRDSEMATMTYGQGINVNMVQMLAAENVIANNGRYAQPHVVERVGGKPTALATAPQPQLVSPETATQVTQMMASVVQNGSGWKTRIPGFEKQEAGKTGTSQMFIDGKYTLDVWSSYVGFMPTANPRFTMLVVIRQPHNDSWDHNDGYYVAAPIWKTVAQNIILDWHIAPTP